MSEFVSEFVIEDAKWNSAGLTITAWPEGVVKLDTFHLMCAATSLQVMTGTKTFGQVLVSRMGDQPYIAVGSDVMAFESYTFPRPDLVVLNNVTRHTNPNSAGLHRAYSEWSAYYKRGADEPPLKYSNFKYDNPPPPWLGGYRPGYSAEGNE